MQIAFAFKRKKVATIFPYKLLFEKLSSFESHRHDTQDIRKKNDVQEISKPEILRKKAKLGY